MTARLPAAILALVAISLVLAACGRRPGQLDTPFEAQMEQRREAERDDVSPLPPQPTPPERDRPFILDRLI
jgi:predicted small lipoprotein YifL